MNRPNWRRRAETAAQTVIDAYLGAVPESPHRLEELTPRRMLALLSATPGRSSPYVRILDRPPYDEEYDRLRVAGMLAQLRAGTAIDVVYAREGLNERRWRDEVEPLLAAGLRARIADVVPMKAILSDVAVFVLPDDGAVFHHPDVPSIAAVRSGPLHAALSEVFTALWRSARTAGPAEAVQQELLGLVAAGLPDGVIAAKLGISPRTFYRKLSALMVEFDCADRFQLGLRYHAMNTTRRR
ncbi:hypothetical protein ACFPM7_23720 [Actinokineospora guangxiensis]|uniref:HTH luxR-type domain-containing protein n=1 Tax=Actinokineospora guangxiensis TaxID=1490288 RepID=A0ABW0EV95_9PSEU